AGLPANATAPTAIAVTPKPAQLEIPFWVTGGAAAEVAMQAALPVLARGVSSSLGAGAVQPATAAIKGSLDPDREVVSAWAEAGATHLLLEPPPDSDLAAVMTIISRYLAP